MQHGVSFCILTTTFTETIANDHVVLKEEIETAMRLCGMTDLMRDAHPDLVNTSSLDFMVPGLRHPYARKVDKSAGWLSSLRSKL
jgi:L-lactate dehydrogenase (cytochrome)